MAEDQYKFQRGMLIGFEKGEYSDFEFCGILVALHDIDLKALAHECVEEQRREQIPYDGWDAQDPDAFMGWLVAKQHAAPISCSTVFLGTTGQFADDFCIPEEC